MSIADKLTTIAENQERVFEAGKKSEYDPFWDAFQDNGKRLNYQYGFGYFWEDTNFKPKYPIIFGLGYTGAYCFWNTTVSNLAERLEEQGVYMDTTLCGHWANMFQLCKTSRIPELNCTHAHEYYAAYGLYYTFVDCTVETIDKMIVTENLKYSYAFMRCTNLKNIRFEGVIANSIDFQWSPLTAESITSIINALSSTVSGMTLTLSKTAVNTAFTTDEWNALAATKSNWTISLI